MSGADPRCLLPEELERLNALEKELKTALVRAPVEAAEKQIEKKLAHARSLEAKAKALRKEAADLEKQIQRESPSSAVNAKRRRDLRAVQAVKLVVGEPGLTFRELALRLSLASPTRASQIVNHGLKVLRSRTVPVDAAKVSDSPAHRRAVEREALRDDPDLLRRRVNDVLGLSVRSRNCLESAGILTLGDLVQRSAGDLLTVKNFAGRSLYDVRWYLEQVGLKLRGD